MKIPWPLLSLAALVCSHAQADLAPSTEILGHEKDYTAANAEAAKALPPTG